MFKELCGEDAYKHVVLATSMWSKEKASTAVQREQELINDGGFWKVMKERGSSVMRWLDDNYSANSIVEHLLEARRNHGVVALKIQRELVDEGMTLVNTSAGQEVNKELSELRDKLEDELRRIQQENKDAMATKDVEWQESLVEQRIQLEKQRRMAEESQEALKVNFMRLLAETDAKYRKQMDGIREELRKAEEKMRHAQELHEEKDQTVRVLEAKLASAHTMEEQQRLQQKLMEEVAQMKAARIEEERLRREIEEKKERESKIVQWLKRIGQLVFPILGTLAATAMSGMLG